MEFKILNVEQKNNSEKISNYTRNKYQKILNNLLQISSRGDSAIFTKISRINLDIFKVLSEKDLSKILNSHNFKILLTPKKMSLTDKELWIVRWRKNIKQIQETYEQTNIWPLFIGTYFLKCSLDEKKVYAPLILKEVEVEIIDNEVYLTSRSDTVIVNDKIKFLLEEFKGIVLPSINEDVEKVSLSDVDIEMDNFLKNSISFESFTFVSEFQEIKSNDILNKELIKVPGIVLIFASPGGGILRKVVLDLIKEDKIDKLITLDSDTILSSSNDTIEKVIIDKTKLVRICPTDASQERAIISSLNNSTIIIGPPGTGKSQTIANILVNILFNNKKALFISQKRVALEVVLERMNSLKYFTLQLAESKSKVSHSEKEIFYFYLKTFIENIKNSFPVHLSPQSLPKELVSEKLSNFWNSKNNKSVTSDEINAFCLLKQENILIDKMWINFFIDFFNSLDFIHIKELITSNIKRKKDFFEKINREPSFRIFNHPFFKSTDKHLFLKYKKFVKISKEYHLDLSIIEKLSTINNLKNLISLEENYHIYSEPLPKANKFISNEDQIHKILSQRCKFIYQKIHRENPGLLRKFIGRVERGYTPPIKFIDLFRKELKQLFNIYVSTPEALSSFVDFKNEKFDYVIFDEASQMFLEKAIPYLSIAKNIIVAGDDQQMQPSNWFGLRSDDSDLDNSEENIDSLLTYAIESGIPKQILELNYRSSSAALTSFSSKHFYDNNLKAVDKNAIIDCPIEIINVKGEWKNRINEVEARKSIQVLKNNINNYEKIILLTLNIQQLQFINDILSNEEPEIYNKIIDGQILLKNLENIQGDEADLVIISIAYTKDSLLSSTYVGRTGGRNALNVAITRAKSKMIIIKSISSNQIRIRDENNIDLQTFRDWIRFLEMNEEDRKTYSLISDVETTDVESGFEHDVLNWLLNQQYSKPMKVVSQYPIGSYRIDFALVDKNTNAYILGVEVDGYKYHSTIKQRYNDLIRQSFIESKGYKLIRISEILWKTDKNKILNLINQNS